VRAILLAVGQPDLLTMLQSRARGDVPWPKAWGPEPELERERGTK
jgi:hypothetical protein